MYIYINFLRLYIELQKIPNLTSNSKNFFFVKYLFDV